MCVRWGRGWKGTGEMIHLFQAVFFFGGGGGGWGGEGGSGGDGKGTGKVIHLFQTALKYLANK